MLMFDGWCTSMLMTLMMMMMMMVMMAMSKKTKHLPTSLPLLRCFHA